MKRLIIWTSAVASVALLSAGVLFTRGARPGTDDSGPLTTVAGGRVADEVAFVESLFAAELQPVPRIVVASRKDISAYLSTQNEDLAPARLGALEMNAARQVMGLPPAGADELGVVDAAAFYERTTNTVVIKDDGGRYSRERHGSTLVHELTHAMDFVRSEPVELSSADSGFAEWAFYEGRANHAAALWEQRRASPGSELRSKTDDEPSFVGLREAGDLLGEWRIVAESQSGDASRVEAAFGTDVSAPTSFAPFVDPSLPLEWTPTVVPAPRLPAGSTEVASDQLGPLGWALVLEAGGSDDISSSIWWRGEATTVFRAREGSTCFASQTLWPSNVEALRFASAIATALPDAELSLDGQRLDVRSCKAPRRQRPPKRVGLGGLVSVVDMAHMFARGDTLIKISVAAATCVADRMHLGYAWPLVHQWNDAELDRRSAEAEIQCTTGEAPVRIAER